MFLNLLSSHSHCIRQGFAALLLLCAVSGNAQTGTAPPDVDAIAKEFAQNAAILARLRGTTQTRTVDAQGVETQNQKVQWATDGDKCYRSKTKSGVPGADIEVYDGKMNHSSIPRGDAKTPVDKAPRLYITNQQKMLMIYEFHYGFMLHGKLFSDLVQQAEFRFVGQEEDATHGTVYKFSNQGADTKRYETFSLSPRNGYLSVKTESHSESRGEVQDYTWAVRKFQKIGDSFFPEVCEQRSETTEDGRMTVRVATETISDLSADVPASLFVVNPKPGDAVKESETNKYWRIGKNGEKIYVDISNKNRTSTIPK